MEPSPRPHADFVQAFRDAFPEGDRTDRSVSLEGVELGLTYDPQPGVELRIEGTDPQDPGEPAAVVTGYAAAAERPASYPPELPYVAGLKVSTMISPDGGSAGATATWWKVSQPDAVLADILAQSAAAGWTESTEPDPPLPPGIRMISLHRGGERRVVHVASAGENAMIMLLDNGRD